MNEPVFGIYLRGVKYNAVVSPSMMKTVFSTKAVPPNNQMLDQALQNVFGDRSLIHNLGLERNQGISDNAATILSDESFIAEASSAIIRLVRRDMPNLVSFCRSLVDQNSWERGISGVEVPDENDQTVCEANLFALTSNFIGHIMTTFLMGEAFVDNFPNLSEDLGRLDQCFVTLFAGIARWAPHPAASAGHAASGRLRHIMSVFHRAFTAWDDGIDPGIEFRDLDDVSELVKDRMRTFRKLGLSHGASAAGHLSLYYELIEYTTKITFWTVTHLFADPTLLGQVRKEIASYAVASRLSRQETGFPFDEPARLSLDIDRVLTSCPLFKSCYYETVRLHSAGISVRKLASNVTLSESAEEAAYGLTNPRTYKIAKGENIILPHGAYHHDARYFSNPEQYDPLRFLVTDPATGAQRADPSILAPFADGLYGSTNNGFAERAILTFTAGIVALWEIEPTNGQFLSVPGHKTSWGAFRPTKELRVKMKQRV
ncbi:Cytochrome P450 [Penicillium paradoxum]|uniref:Cytochrome P450 n=1 Tax=Penicillium paradoxum TaxID=176176 RepID=UPI0025483EA3|nr:Cytochrome P450 [Penicillium paradoxum]KAJ5794414.1 Cytochrome P450 [Penicillium paradoxum]